MIEEKYLLLDFSGLIRTGWKDIFLSSQKPVLDVKQSSRSRCRLPIQISDHSWTIMHLFLKLYYFSVLRNPFSHCFNKILIKNEPGTLYMKKEMLFTRHISQTRNNSVNVIFLFKHLEVSKDELKNRKIDRSSRCCAPIKPHELASMQY